jgi:hypothetical protein
MSKTNLGDSWYIEYSVKGEDEPRYQILSPMNEDKLLMYIDTYLTNEQYYIDGSYNFFDVLPLDIESIKVIDNTRYQGLKAYDSIIMK